MVSVKQGETAILQCDVSGDRPISVVWLRGGMELTPATNYRYCCTFRSACEVQGGPARRARRSCGLPTRHFAGAPS